MSEFDLRHNYLENQGYPIKIDYSLIQLDLYRLLCYFAASRVVNDLSKNYPSNSFNKFLRFEYEKSEISRIILNLAVLARNELDNNNESDYLLNCDSINSVGFLYTEKDYSVSKNLNFREACNKIIHCNFINWDLENAKSINDYEGLNPYIYLYGDYKGKEWRVLINIYDFIDKYTELIQL